MHDSKYITVDDGQLVVAAEFLPLLQTAGLDSFDRIMALPTKSVVRAIPGRSTIRVELPLPTGDARIGYLKRYGEEYLSTLDKVLRLIHWPGSGDEASREWRKMLRLRTHNLLTAFPIAAGRSRRAGIVTSSFLLQEEIPDGLPADDYIVQRLATAPPQRKWDLFRKLGQLARAFQDAGFIHKDFYLKHIFVVERGDDWDLYLIDLQRVLGPRTHRQRWYTKDLSALAHSARRRAHLSLPNILRIYLGYARTTKLQAADKRRIQNIWRRVRRLRGHQPRYGRIWNAAEP